MTITVRPPLVFFPNPRPTWWGTNPDAHNVSADLPLPTQPIQNPQLESTPPKRLPGYIPTRGYGPQRPFFIPPLDAPAPKRYPEFVQPNVTVLLPNVLAANLNLFDGVPPPKKLPPYIVASQRSQPKPAPVQAGTFEAGPPPKKLPPHMPVRANRNLTFFVPPTNLAQLESEFDAWGMPKKYPGESILFPNVVLNVVAPVVPPPPHGPEYPSKVTMRWTEDAAFPNIPVLPPLIGMAQAEDDFSPTGLPVKRWFADHPFPNVAIQPLAAVNPPVITYEYPSKVRIQWAEDAAAPNVASQPTFVAPGFSYDYPAKARITWPEDAAPTNVLILPQAAAGTRIGVTQYRAKQWPGDPFPFTNWVQEVIPPPPSTILQGFTFDWPKRLILTLDDFQNPLTLQPPPIPIYIPILDHVIYIPPRRFTIATPVRAFSITVLERNFTISNARGSVQTFDVKDPAESWPLTFNMAPDLLSGETLVGPISVTVTLIQGADPNPPGILSGLAGFDPNSIMVIQPVSGGIAGCTYEIIVTCPTSNPLKTLTLVGVLPVQR